MPQQTIGTSAPSVTELVKGHKNSPIKQNVGMKKNWYDTKTQEKYDNRQFNQKDI